MITDLDETNALFDALGFIEDRIRLFSGNRHEGSKIARDVITGLLSGSPVTVSHPRAPGMLTQARNLISEKAATFTGAKQTGYEAMAQLLTDTIETQGTNFMPSHNEVLSSTAIQFELTAELTGPWELDIP